MTVSFTSSSSSSSPPTVVEPVPSEGDAIARGGVATPFPWRLHECLTTVEEEGLTSIVSWLPHGRAFKVHKIKEFSETIMPRFFGQTKYPSFQRQLNLYSFSRFAHHAKDKGAYYHSCFVQGQPQLVRQMVRRKVKGTKVRRAFSPSDEPDFYLSHWEQSQPTTLPGSSGSRCRPTTTAAPTMEVPIKTLSAPTTVGSTALSKPEPVMILPRVAVPPPSVLLVAPSTEEMPPPLAVQNTSSRRRIVASFILDEHNNAVPSKTVSTTKEEEDDDLHTHVTPTNSVPSPPASPTLTAEEPASFCDDSSMSANNDLDAFDLAWNNNVHDDDGDNGGLDAKMIFEGVPFTSNNNNIDSSASVASFLGGISMLGMDSSLSFLGEFDSGLSVIIQQQRGNEQPCQVCCNCGKPANNTITTSNGEFASWEQDPLMDRATASV
mmetsp:Transcript_22157/g.61571  ORF Transcript_22157/g.61571 Transcript_22157/m.61571 type:complete len:435 (+) Transcript_22157:89-1393(+)